MSKWNHQRPPHVWVGQFRKDGRTAITVRRKTALSWMLQGHEVTAYVPDLPPVRKTGPLARFAYWLLEKAK